MTQRSNELDCSSLCHAIPKSLTHPSFSIQHRCLPHLVGGGDTCPQCYNNGIPLPKSRTHDRCGGYDLRSQFRGASLPPPEKEFCQEFKLCRSRAKAAHSPPSLIYHLRYGLRRRRAAFAKKVSPKLRRRPSSPCPSSLARLANGRVVGKGADAAKKRKWKESEMCCASTYVKTKSRYEHTLSKEIRTNLARKPAAFPHHDCREVCTPKSSSTFTVEDNLDQNHALKNISKQSIAGHLVRRDGIEALSLPHPSRRGKPLLQFTSPLLAAKWAKGDRISRAHVEHKGRGWTDRGRGRTHISSR